MRQRALSSLATKLVVVIASILAAPKAWSGDATAQSAANQTAASALANGRNTSSGDVTSGIVSWFERAGQEYQDSVVDPLSAPTGRGSRATSKTGQTATAGSASNPSPGIFDKLRELFSLGTQAPSSSPELKAPGEMAATDRLSREIEARKREQDRNAEEQRVATNTRQARENADRATVERQKLAEAARIAEAVRLSARPSEVAAAPAVEPQPTAPVKSTPTVPPRTIAQAIANPTGDPAVGSARRDEDVTKPKDTSAGPKEPAQTASTVKPEVATKRAPGDAPQQPAHPDAASSDAKVAAMRLADSATKAAAKALTKAQKPSRSLASVANDEGNPASRRTGGRSKRCGAAGRLVASTSIYVVKSGDTLWDIARRYYDRGSAFGKIVRANEARLSDPDLIFPCQKVYLPGRHAFLLIEHADDTDPS